MEDIEEVVTHHEVTCLFRLHPRNIPHCCLQNVINTCHLEAQLMKLKVKASSPMTISIATKSIIFHWWCCFQYFTLIQILLQNRVIDIGVDSVIDVNADIDADIDRDVDVGINYEIDVNVYLCFCQ